MDLVLYDSGKITEGPIEAVRHDGSLLWLKQNGAELRWLVEKLPGRIIEVAADSK